MIKSGVNAVVDVEKFPSLFGKAKILVAELLYRLYSRFVFNNSPISAAKIMQFISWAEESVQPVEDPTNTQAIVLTKLNPKLVDPKIPYQQRIPLGVNTLIKNFSEIVIGIDNTNISILNMNLSDSVFPTESLDDFVSKSLIPKIFVPIQPLPLSRFEIGEYDAQASVYAGQLVKLGKELASTDLLPSGFKINDVMKRKSHRDIVDWMINGRTGVSYGFVAYAEPPQYIGAVEISESDWDSLSTIEGFGRDELRQNEIGRRYIKTKIAEKYVFKQIPDIWLASSRSGSNKTNLNLETDVFRIGLQDRLLLQLPKGLNSVVGDIKPSYDLYVMVAIALAAALYAPKLIENGMPMVHFHGYPSKEWLQPHEYCTGVQNPSVPCGTYESGVFNFLGIYNLVFPCQTSVTDVDVLAQRLAAGKETFDIFRLFGTTPDKFLNQIMQKGWTWIHHLTMPLNKLLIKLNYDAGVRIFEENWREQQPDMVVSVVPLFNKMIWESLQRVKPGTPLVTVLIDFADFPSAYWIEPQTGSYVVCGAQKAVEQARSLGVKEDLIVKTSGMVINPRFYEPIVSDRAQERQRLGLDPDCLTGLVLFGGNGSKVMLEIAKRLERFQQKLQLIFFVDAMKN